VIQSILYFALGVLCAGLVVMIVAPIIWRRAVILTRKRIEASVPLTVDEILAHKDRLRAEHAMTVRRLEMSVKQLRRKVATQLAEIGNNGAELRALSADKDDKDKSIVKLTAVLERGAAETKEIQDNLDRVAEQLRAAEETIEERGEQLEQLGREVEAISLTSSNRQVDLAAREGDIDRLHSEFAAMREQRKDLEREVRDAKAEARAANEVLQVETRKTADMGKRIDKLMADISDREELLERRAREMDRLKEKLKEAKVQAATEVKAAPQPAAQAPEKRSHGQMAQNERLKIVELMSPLVGELPPDGDYGKAAKKLSKEIKRDREKIVALERTVQTLQTRMAARNAGLKTDASAAELRDQINEIAAEMIHITALLEGEGSPINEILNKDEGTVNGGGRRSLADRVRALQKAAEKPAGGQPDNPA
jgi:septal ring factor EnvC (AmiA/AmiB activator)